MSKFEYGLRRAITEAIMGAITSAILLAFINSGNLDPSYSLLFQLLNIVGIIGLIQAMPYWGTTYLIGWLIGTFIMYDSGLIGTFELLIYIGVSILILIRRISKSITD